MTATKTKNLTEKLTKLEAISQYFEGAEIDIDEAIKKYEEGVKLAAEIKKQLTAYETKITEIKAKYANLDLVEDDELLEETVTSIKTEVVTETETKISPATSDLDPDDQLLPL